MAASHFTQEPTRAAACGAALGVAVLPSKLKALQQPAPAAPPAPLHEAALPPVPAWLCKELLLSCPAGALGAFVQRLEASFDCARLASKRAANAVQFEFALPEAELTTLEFTFFRGDAAEDASALYVDVRRVAGCQTVLMQVTRYLMQLGCAPRAAPAGPALPAVADFGLDDDDDDLSLADEEAALASGAWEAELSERAAAAAALPGALAEQALFAVVATVVAVLQDVDRLAPPSPAFLAALLQHAHGSALHCLATAELDVLFSTWTPAEQRAYCTALCAAFDRAGASPLTRRACARALAQLVGTAPALQASPRVRGALVERGCAEHDATARMHLMKCAAAA